MPERDDFLSGITGRWCKKCECLETDYIKMKQCSRCKSALYCSRECQKADWKGHKKICLKNVQAESATTAASENRHIPAPNTARTLRPPHRPIPTPEPGPAVIGPIIAPGLDVNLTAPFTRLYVKRWLHGRSEKDVYKILFDTIRVRAWDDRVLAAQSLMDVANGSRPQAAKMFVLRFLRQAERQRCLPPWWSPEKEQECTRFGTSEENWNHTDRPIRMHHIVARYGTPLILVQMRIFAEQVYGPIVGKMSSIPMMRVHMRAERGDLIRNLLEAAKAK
jgi:splicing suppressor protein 51